MPILSLSTDRVQPRPSPLRWATFAFSVLVHLGVATSLLWFDILLQIGRESTHIGHYQIMMLPKPEPNRPRVLWYVFRKPVPEVAAEKPFGPAKTPQGQKDPQGRTLIAHSLTPASKKQVIWQPKHPEPILEDVPAPNLADPPPQAAPVRKPALKQFTSPPSARRNAAAAPMVEPPPPPLVHSTVADLREERILHELQQKALEQGKRPPLKTFVDPASRPGTGSGAARVIDPTSIPDLAGPGGSGQGVIVGLNPTDRFTVPIPLGSRSGEFSRAPAAGPPSSGSSSSPDAPRVPGVMARGDSSPRGALAAPEGASAAVPERKILKEILLPPMNRTMSAPLRPSSRVLPATVEERFARRDVFVLVIPGPKLPGYSGNWVLWFAARQSDAGSVARILAPVPTRKADVSEGDGTALDSTGKGVVQFEALVDPKGRIVTSRVLSSQGSEPFRRRALAELRTWEFKPTLRNGEPIDVDVVIEIPFDFRPASAQTR